MKSGVNALIRIAIVAAPLALFAWLLRIELVPSGTFVVRHAVDESSPYVDRLLPDARVEPPFKLDGTMAQNIVDEPAFFYVHPHRQFDRVDVTVFFRNEGNPIVELGGLARTEPEIYDLHPLQNLTIDRLPWTKLEEGGLLLLQREPKFDSVASFLAQLPPRHEIATYHYDLPAPYVMPGYAPQPGTRVIDASLRGFHELKTYVKGETLRFAFDYMDMNRAEGTDPVTLIVFSADGKAVGEARAEDDGNASADARPSGMRTLAIEIPDLPEGVYKLEMRASRDVFFRRVGTLQSKIVFLNSLYLGDEVAYREVPRPISFWTEAGEVAFSTQHAEGVQEAIVGSQRVAIAEPYARYEAHPSGEGVTKVTLPKGDAVVDTNGHVAFSPDQFFNPDPVRLRDDTDLDRLGVDYLIAEYTTPKFMPIDAEGRGDSWWYATATFDADVLAGLEDGTWKFAFSVPGIKERKTPLTVSRIDLAMHRAPFRLGDVTAWITRLVSRD